MDPFSYFKEFINEKIKRLLQKKELCKILLFGAYYPPSEKEFLIKIRDDIRNEGYINTFLVEDFPKYPNLNIREKSFACLEFSDINVFVITFSGKQAGSSAELEHIIKNASSLSFKTIVTYEYKLEIDDKINSLSPLQEDGLKFSNIKLIPFLKEEYSDFFELLRAQIWNKHYHYVIHENRY